MTVLEIKGYYDTMCPWCYIGNKALDRTLSLFRKTYPNASADKVTFTYLPYFVNPSLPTPGLDWSEVVARKNGEERVNAIRTRLARVGRDNGIEFKFGKVGNTRASHRMIQYVQKRSNSSTDSSGDGGARTKQLVEAVFRMHFEDKDSDLSMPGDLIRAAVEAGWDEREIRTFLESDEESQEVDELVRRAKDVDGIEGVPTYEINGLRVVGAEDSSVFYATLVAAKAKGAAFGGSQQIE